MKETATMTTDLTAYAYVNHGRWVADCPFCGGAERVWPEGIRTHKKVPHPFGIADDILHCGYTGQTCQVVFPDDRREIARVLAKRPDDANRNWFAHETVDDLERENAQRGIS